MGNRTPRRHVHYENPPVIEVVCGVMFQPIQGFSTAWYGLLWNRFGDEFSSTSDQAPLPLPVPPPPPGQVRIDLTPGMNLPRVWFASEDGKLIQVQRDRFHFNWQKEGDGDEYPQFPAVYSEFKRHLSTMVEFLTEGGVPEPQHVQYELTYVNRIPVDDVWQGFQHVRRVLPDLAWRGGKKRFLPTPDHLHWDAGFPMEDGAGVLNVKVRSARRRDTGELAIALDLTARGPAGPLEIDDWFEVGHKWIVKGFTDLTGKEMHTRVWRRRGDPR